MSRKVEGESVMNFTMSERQKHWRDRVIAFMDAHVYPAVETYDRQDEAGDRWKVIPIIEELKTKAKTEGLWNLFCRLRQSMTKANFTAPDCPISTMRFAQSRWAAFLGLGNVQLLAAGYRQHGSLHRYGTPSKKPSGSSRCLPAKSVRPF